MKTLQQAATDAASLSQAFIHADGVASTLTAVGSAIRNWRFNGRRVVLELNARPSIALRESVIKRVSISTGWSRRTYAAEYDGVQLEWTTLVPVSADRRHG